MSWDLGISGAIHQCLGFVLEQVNPGLMYLLAAYGGAFGLIGTHPVRITDEKKAVEIVLIHVRLVLLVSIFALAAVGIYLAYFVSFKMYGTHEYWEIFLELSKDAAIDSWPIVPLSMLISWLVAFVWHRQLDPYVSNLKRRFRIRQTGDELSDIRVEQRRLKTKNFDPRKFYKKDFMFMGLDQNDQPIYISDVDFKSRNIKTIGPTQTGKGVAMGVLIDQAIRKGWVVFFVNPKPDRFIPNIMREACAAAGRDKPVQIDLNGVGVGKYGPFVAGTPRQRRERLLWASGLNDDGNQADFYKAGERAIVDQLLPKWDGSVTHLHQLLHPKKSGDLDEVKTNSDIYKKTERLRSYVAEWRAHKPLTATADRGFSIARTIQEKGVAHIVSHTREKLVKSMTTVLLMDLIQSIEGLGSQERPHIFVVIDEVKFMISETLAAGLATVLDKGCNMAVAYQAVNDLLALEDKRLNKEAIKQAVEINCKLTLCYRAEDPETAEWAAERSGTIQKKVASMEKVQQNRMGAEVWEKERTLRATEENLLSANKIQSLPDRVAGFYEPGHLARLLYTCWVPVEEMRDPVERNKAIVEEDNGNKSGSGISTPVEFSALPEPFEPEIGDEIIVPGESETPESVEPAEQKKSEEEKLRDDEAIRKAMREKIRQLASTPTAPTIDANAALSDLLMKAKKIGTVQKETAIESTENTKKSTDRGGVPLLEDLNQLNDDLSKL